MFERKTQGMFGTDPLGGTSGKDRRKVHAPSTGMFGNGERGLPSFKDVAPKKTPFEQDLLSFANWQVRDVPFPKIASDFVNGNPLSPEFMRLMRVGLAYHMHGIEGIVYDLAGQGIKTEIVVPTVVKNGDKRQVVLPPDAKKIAGSLQAIVGSRILPDGRVMFDGLAKLEGKDRESTRLRVVGIDPANGRVFFHPDFLPNSDNNPVITRVIPPQRT